MKGRCKLSYLDLDNLNFSEISNGVINNYQRCSLSLNAVSHKYHVSANTSIFSSFHFEGIKQEIDFHHSSGWVYCIDQIKLSIFCSIASYFISKLISLLWYRTYCQAMLLIIWNLIISNSNHQQIKQWKSYTFISNYLREPNA